MIYIIGSGPAGVSAAKALLARGLSVTMLDVGITLEEDKKNILAQFNRQHEITLFQRLKHSFHDSDNIKLSYGSDYIYRGTKSFLDAQCEKNIFCMPSFAQGGLSNAWGAFVMPYLNADLKDWPISLSSLSKYYEKVAEYVPISIGTHDRSDIYPTYKLNSQEYQTSAQATQLLKIMKKNESILSENKIEFGSARLAVNFSSCIYCGLCQHGCPYQLIYSARDTLNELKKNPLFNYMSDIVVSDYSENESGVLINARYFSTNQAVTFNAAQVFLAAGAIASTKILLDSLKLYNIPVTLKDSQHFLLPAITYKAFKNVKSENHHTLTQLYLKLNDQAYLKKPAHLQLYTYMDHYEEAFKKRLKFAYSFLKFAIKPVLNRMIVLQGFLDSDDSQICTMRLSEDNKTITFETPNKTQTNEAAIINTLFKNRKKLGFIPVRFMSEKSKLLRSYHFGGSFPMSKKNSITTTDLLGRPFGSKRVHVIDATVFPSIPAGAITFSIMANAYRIASECDIYG